MKVLILANNDVGLYRFRKELIIELMKKNQVILSLPYGKLVELFKETGCVYIETPIERRGMNPIKDLLLFRDYLMILKREKPDLVMAYTIKPNIYGGIACEIKKIPYAINITGLGTAFQEKGILCRFVTLLYKISLKAAKVVFFENSDNRKVFVDGKIVREEQTILLNGAGVNLKHYVPTKYPMDDGKTNFLFVGRIMKEKGIEELFDAMKGLLKEGILCSLDILGGYEEDYGEKIKEYEKEGWLRYHGYQEDIRPFVRNCHCLVLPSWHEGMANTNLEGAAMARPLITSDIAGCREAVVDGISGYLCRKKNVESLYLTMKKFVNLPHEERKKMGAAGRKHMEDNFDREKILAKTFDALRIRY